MSTRLSREDDHLGLIRRALVELTGYGAMAFELIQNADDTQRATWLRFDKRNDALWVEDDGGFSDCERQDLGPDRCPFRAERGHRCDFHSFRLVSGADKRSRENTTGAMGIGFTSVYQVTDRPELISGRRHWMIDETQPQDDRIEETELDPPHAGTLIVLPWARDPQSEFRARVQVAPAPPDVEDQVLDALHDVLAPAMLFLRNLVRLEIARNGEVERMVTRVVEGDDVLIEDAGDTSHWRLLRGDFAAEASALRDRFTTEIEDTRSARVSVAIPVDSTVDGRLCATLPTGTGTGLPIHVNADFFVASDRRRPLMSAPFAIAWNEAAIGCAGQILADHLGALRELLGPQRLWALLEAAWKLYQSKSADPVDVAQRGYWQQIEPKLANHEIVWTSGGGMALIADARIARSPEEEPNFPALDALGIPVAHPELRQHFNVMRSLGIEYLDVEDIAEAIDALGIEPGVTMADLDGPLAEPIARGQLWAVLGHLVGDRPSDATRDAARQALDQLALMPSCSGMLVSMADTYRADPGTSELFDEVLPERPFIDADTLPSDAAPVLELCDELSTSAAISELKAIHAELSGAQGASLVAWFARREDLDEEEHPELAALPIVPGADGHCYPLDELALPGDFEDVLSIARLVATPTAERHGAFLADLGALSLSLAVYINDHVARAMAEDALSVEDRRALAAMIAEKWSTLSDDPTVRQTMASLQLIECADGSWVDPSAAYQDGEVVRTVLAEHAPIAIVPAEHAHAYGQFLADLGVADEPRRAAVLSRVEHLVEKSPTEERIEAIEHIVSWLGSRWLVIESADRAGWEPLRDLRWLPRRESGGWHLPSKLDLEFQRPAFDSQGAFVALPRRLQDAASGLLQWLGLAATPSTRQIVDHLLHCADEDIQPNSMVYALLNGRLEDDTIDELRDVPCLRLEGTWRRPDEAYWGEHPFGRWRVRLDGFADARGLLDKLGVRDTYEARDAISVLHDISNELGPSHDEIPGDDRAVTLSCWRLGERGLSDGSLHRADLEELGGEPTVVDDRGILMRPSVLFFEDLPGLAGEFPVLVDHILRRPDGAAEAMLAAGVRNLSQVANAAVVDVGDRLDEPPIGELVEDRTAELARLVSASDGTSWQAFAHRLDELAWVPVTALTIGWELEEFSRRFSSSPRAAYALWHRSEDAIYIFVSNAHVASWEAAARELLRAAWQGQPPPGLGLAVAAVLQAPDRTAASQSLDESGIPALADELEESAVGSTATEFDTSTDEVNGDHGGWHGADDSDLPDQQQHDDEPNLDASDEEAPARDVLDAQDDAADQAEGRGGGSSAGGDANGRSGSTSGSEGEQGEPGGRGRGSGDGKQRPEHRLRSYVVSKEEAEDREDGDDGQGDSRNAEIDNAGVEAVLEYERAHGREAERMGHTNPGYDVISHYEDGELARWIEVKSTAGPWDAKGVGLSPTQFRFAQRADDGQCWLYVVEYALSEDGRRVWAIPDPVDQITDYMFDDGWRGLAEPPSPGVAEDTVSEL